MTKRSLFLVAAVASRNPISTDGKVHHAAGEVESVVNIILQRPLAAHAQHLRVLQPMLAAAPEALLTGPLSPAKLLQDEGIMKWFPAALPPWSSSISLLQQSRSVHCWWWVVGCWP
jgi:hypothetical protein